MFLTWYRNWVNRKAGSSKRARSRTDAGRQVYYRPCAELLEDRTLLSSGLTNVFGALQNALDAHCLLPSVSFSLPLVGNNLGNDPNSQFLSALGNAVGVVGATNTTGLQSVIANVFTSSPYINTPSNAVQVTAPHDSQPDFEIKITNAQINLPSEAFDPGLPGLAMANVSNPLTQLISSLAGGVNHFNVTVSMTYSLQLFYRAQGNNVTLDTNPNVNTPLLKMDLDVELNQTLLAQSLGFFKIDVNGNASFKPTVQLNVDANTYLVPQSQLDLNGNSHVVLSNAQTNLVLDMPVNMSPLPGLDSKLTVTWNLSGTDPLDNINNSAKPTIAFDLSLDLSTVVNWMNSILGPVAEKLAPLKPIIKTVETVLQTKIPLVGDLFPSLGTLEGILKNNVPNGQQIDDFLNALDAIVSTTSNLSSLTGSGKILLAHVDLLNNSNDPRRSDFDLGAAFPNPSQVSLTQGANSFLSNIHLPGTLTLPLIANPLDDLKALLLGNNVVLVQWQLPNLNIPNLAGITIGPFYIFPPLALKLGLSFGIQGGLTLGYDTFGFTRAWATDKAKTGDRITSGVFIQDAHLVFSGSISLTAAADLQIVQAGATGTITLSFGIQGLNDVPGQHGAVLDGGQPLSSNDHPYHAVSFAGQSENVLQLGDFLWDVQSGPLCPFVIGGEISASLSVFITLGVDPFSITFTYNFGSITIASFTIDCCSSGPNPQPIAQTNTNVVPPLPNYDQQLSADDTTYFNKTFPGTKATLLLDLGKYVNSSYLGQEADFEISPGPNPNDLLVQGFGQAMVFPGLNTIDSQSQKRTTIVAIGDPNPGSSKPIKITVDQGVHANAYFVGGANVNSFNYQGDGETYLKGGPATLATGTPQNPKPQNTLVGGSNNNYLEGGDLAAVNPPLYSNQAWWNSLRGGSGPVALNVLRGGNAGASLYAGPGADRLYGGNGASSYFLVAGKGDDRLVGGGPQAFNQFDWNEGDGNVDVTGGANTFFSHSQNGSTAANVFNIAAATPNETWNIGQNAGDIVVSVIPNSGKVIRARRLQVLSVDDSPHIANPNPPPDFIYPPGQYVKYTLDDLSSTRINLVNLNLHEQANPDVYQDSVTVNAPRLQDTVDLGWYQVITAYDASHNPIYGATTDLNITASVGAGVPPVAYEINTAIPKPSDTLTVNTFNSPNNDTDTVNIESTQPNVQKPATGGHVYVNTGGGDDQITVGNLDEGLDNFFGPLDIDAGTGHNQIRFTEGNSRVHDIVTLSASQLIRYTQTLPVTFVVDPATGRTTTQIGYPFIINYKATQGDFGGGVSFVTSIGSTDLYLPETGTNAPLTVTTQSGNSNDRIFVGFDGAFPPNQSQVTIQNITFGAHFPTTAAGSTLDLMRSPLVVHGRPGNPAVTLAVEDEAAPSGETYTVGIATTFTLPPTPIGEFVARPGAAEIRFDRLDMTLDTSTHQTTSVAVLGVFQGTSVTVNARGQTNSVTVGDIQNKLDGFAGPMTVNGQAGAATTLLINDQGAMGSPQPAYSLAAATLVRTRPSLVVQISYSGLQNLTLNVAGGGTTIVNVLGTAAGTNYVINTGTGSSSYTINLSSATNSLDPLQGVLTIQGQGGPTTLVINDQGTSTPNLTYTLTAITFQRTGTNLVNYANIQALTINTGTGVDTVNVQSTSGPLSVNTFGGGGQDVVALGNAGSVQSIRGVVTIGLSSLSTAQVRVDDSADPTGQTVTLSAAPTGTITGLLPNNAPIIYDLAHTASVTVTGGLGGNRFLITGTASGLPTTVNPGTANDQVNIQGSSATGPLTIGTGSGDTVSLRNAGNTLDGIGPVTVNDPTGTSSVTADDSGFPGPEHYVVTVATVAIGRPAAFALAYNGTRALNLKGSQGGNAFDLSAGTPAATVVTLTGGGGSNSLKGSNAGNSWEVTGADTGVLSGTAYPNPVGFNHVGNLTAGSGGDSFRFDDQATLSGNLTGGGSDTLDYSPYSTSVRVDLQTGVATGVGGSVSGIGTVLGGNGNGSQAYNLLIGNGSNTLIGGTGRSNILVAGGSASTLVGGDSNDLLIGGTTIYDTDPALASWRQIAAYWAGTDGNTDDYFARVSKLTSGNGVPLLNSTTVTGNGGGNTLTGNGELALIFSDGLDNFTLGLPYPPGFDPNSKVVSISP
jgi:hypothetical protein